MSEKIYYKSLSNDLEAQEKSLLVKKREELERLEIPQQDNFLSNDQEYRKAMEKYLEKKQSLEFDIKKISEPNIQRKIGKGQFTNTTLN